MEIDGTVSANNQDLTSNCAKYTNNHYWATISSLYFSREKKSSENHKTGLEPATMWNWAAKTGILNQPAEVGMEAAFEVLPCKANRFNNVFHFHFFSGILGLSWIKDVTQRCLNSDLVYRIHRGCLALRWTPAVLHRLFIRLPVKQSIYCLLLYQPTCLSVTLG